MKQTILIFGGLATALLILFQLSKFSLVSQEIDSDAFITISGLLFVAVGFVLSRFLQKGKNSNKVPPTIDSAQLKKTGLSHREYEILVLVAKGHSNQEIADNLFISEYTVKSHISKILMKLNAKRRTQAIQISRDLNII